MKTERLYLRERTPKLLEELKSKSSEEKLAFFGLEAADLSVAQTNIDRSTIRFANREMKHIKWEIIEQASGLVIGSCGFHNWFEHHERAEIGYNLHPQFRGKGFMLEALRGIINYGFNKMRLNRIEAFIGTWNQASINVVNRLGFAKEGLLREHYKADGKIDDSLIYGLLKKDWNE